jgi:transposase InsO family protein
LISWPTEPTAVERPTSRFSTKSLDVPLVRIVSTFVLLSSAGVCFCSYHTICKARPVLHITDKDTKYGAQRFVHCSSKNPTAAQLWDIFVQAWAWVYIGMPDVVTTDRGTQFTSRDFELALSYQGVKQQYTGVESHHSLGANERAHAVLRRVYLKTRHDHPNIPQELALAYSQKAINETIGTDGLVPTLLVYGSMPRFRAAGLDARLQPNSERFRCMATARAEYTRNVNHQRVQQLLRSRVPPAADRQLHIGQHVFAWREKERKYCGPFAILNLSENGTQVTVNVDRGQRSGVFSADCVRPAPKMADVFLARISSTLSSYSSKAPGMHRAAYTKVEADVLVYVTEAVENKDPRSNGPDFSAAKQKELLGLLERGTFKVVLVGTQFRRVNLIAV